jgi:hypothetical protein
VRLYQRVSKNRVGANLSDTFDLSPVSAGDVDATMGQFTRTVGLPGKGFDYALDLGSENARAQHSREVLVRVARYLLAQEALLRWQPDPTTAPPSPAALGGQGAPVLVAPAPGDLDRRQR